MLDIWHYPRTAFSMHILKGMTNGLLDRVTIFAPRKRGKTAFIRKDIEPECTKLGIMPVYVDFWLDRSNPTRVFILAVDDACQQHESWLSRQFRGLKVKAEISGSGPKLGIEANISDDRWGKKL